ncbi:MAG TPA: hypothetical protein VMQ44_00615 [Candidatus Saccharimonadales bacterium]|nr:hypothetical protein [Candidatus Saccharimonadales bacterium]
MAILLKIIVAILGVGAGTYALTHNYQLTRLFGYNDYAERYLGTGGTYSMWKLIGVVLIIAAVVYLFR